MKKRRIRVNAAVWFLLPYLLMFVTFIVIPVLAAMVLSFTNYDAVQTPKPAGFLNYINLLTQDEIAAISEVTELFIEERMRWKHKDGIEEPKRARQKKE